MSMYSNKLQIFKVHLVFTFQFPRRIVILIDSKWVLFDFVLITGKTEVNKMFLQYRIMFFSNFVIHYCRDLSQHPTRLLEFLYEEP
jgi:hypothetical protein